MNISSQTDISFESYWHKQTTRQSIVVVLNNIVIFAFVGMMLLQNLGNHCIILQPQSTITKTTNYQLLTNLKWASRRKWKVSTATRQHLFTSGIGFRWMHRSSDYLFAVIVVALTTWVFIYYSIASRADISNCCCIYCQREQRDRVRDDDKDEDRNDAVARWQSMAVIHFVVVVVAV